MASKARKLFWIAGPVPTDFERAEAAELGITAFRNATYADTAALERADVVAGLVPAGYDAMPGCRVVKVQFKETPVAEPDPPPAQPLPSPARKGGK